MMKHSVCSSRSQCKKHKESCEKRSPSSQESTNHPAGSSGRKNVETTVGSKVSPSARITSEFGRSAEEDQVGPLSGKPFFTCIMAKAHVRSPYQLAVPISFHSYLPNADVRVVLTSRSRRWEMRYLGGRSIRRFDGGWKHFAVDNQLRIGDGCVFELMDDANLRFEVRTLSGQVPSLFAGAMRFLSSSMTRVITGCLYEEHGF